jgi:RHS repeat-associated protein
MKYSKGATVLRDLTYGYDEINRRTAYSGNTAPAPRDTATDTVTVNALNQYTTRNGKPVSHDDNANQTINNAVWDARDRLISLSGPNFTASFTYDAMGRRTSKTVNGQTKTYLYDGSDLISETGADYTFGPGIDQPLERKSGQNEYYLSDALGSVIGLTDSNGSIKTSYNYSPFGKKQITGTSSSNPFVFTGREDDATGYYYYRARYYSPDQKRFISADPLGFGGGDTNTQAYVGNNPVNATDPSGLITFIIPGGNNEFGSLPKNISSGARYNVTAIPNPAGSNPGPDIFGDKFNNAKNAVDKALANGLKKGEPINIIAHSDGNQSLVQPLAEYLRKRYPNIEIAVGRLDPTPVGKPLKAICKTVDFLSNKLSVTEFDIRDFIGYFNNGDKGDVKANPGVSHMDLLNDPGVLNEMKARFRF